MIGSAPKKIDNPNLGHATNTIEINRTSFNKYSEHFSVVFLHNEMATRINFSKTRYTFNMGGRQRHHHENEGQANAQPNFNFLHIFILLAVLYIIPLFFR